MPLIFAGIRDFMLELSRITFLIEINDSSKSSVDEINGSPTVILSDNEN